MTYGSGSRRFLSVGLGHLFCTVLLTGLVVFVASVCVWYSFGGGGWRGAVTVNAATYLYPYELSIGVGSCLGGPEVSLLRETDVEVQIKVIAFSTPMHGGRNCQDGVVVRLQEPLGDRIVIDGHTGQRVRVTRPIPYSAEETKPAADWRVVKGPEWPSRPAFSLQLPTGWDLIVLEGLGPHPGKVVGEVVGDGARLEFDFGGLSWSRAPSDDRAHSYGFGYEDIGGVRVQMLVSTDNGAGYTGAFFHQVDGPNLHIEGEGLTPEQQRIAVTVFRSIRLPMPEPRDAVEEDPPQPEAPPPFDDVTGITVPE